MPAAWPRGWPMRLRWLAALPRCAPAKRLSGSGRGARLVELAVAAAETWRRQQAQRQEQGLARLDARLTKDLQSELDAVRDAAAELLGLTLAVPGPGERLEPDLRFFYLTAEQAGQTELLAGAIRRWLPGEAGRRRARAYPRRETAGLVPQQIGRARADLQYRLAEATRRLVRAIGARYADSTGRLENALRTAAAAREATAGDAARLDRELAGRQKALDHVLGLLDGAAPAHPDAGGQDPAQPGRPCHAVVMAEGRERRLVLFQHAKSAWPEVADHERPLAERGRRGAPVMGRWLRDAGCVPDQVLCSTARRARETWQLATNGLGTAPPVTFERGVYQASAAGPPSSPPPRSRSWGSPEPGPISPKGGHGSPRS